MAKVDLSLRDRHAIKWHLNVLNFNDRSESRKLDRVFDALKLDAVATKQSEDPVSMDVTPVTYELTSDERDFLIDQFNKPAIGYIRRLLSPIDKALIKSRDGENNEDKK